MTKTIYTLTIFAKDDLDCMYVSWAGDQSKIDQLYDRWCEEQWEIYKGEGENNYLTRDEYISDYFSECGTYSTLVE